MAYRIIYGKENAARRSQRKSAIAKAVTAIMLCTCMITAIYINKDLIAGLLSPDTSAADDVFCTTLAQGEGIREAALRYCRVKLLESGYAG